MRLFLDDIRGVRDVCYYVPNPRIYWELDEWVIVRDYGEFTEYITNNGLPELISFDHDLADFHYVNKVSDYESLSEEEIEVKFGSKEKTGLDCAKWLVEYCIINKLDIPKYFVHSANPVGKKNIESYLENAKKHLS